MKRLLLSVATVIVATLGISCRSKLSTNTAPQRTIDFTSLVKFPKGKIMVVAHRGNWRDAPENSLWAIQKAIETGAHMAEIDLALTKDSVLILMHDKLIDRTTTGKGKPSDYTLEEIKKFYLRDGTGHPTEMRIPTLEEALQVSKGKIYLNLDKGFNYIGLVYPLLKKYNMLQEVLFKGNVDYETFNKNYGHIKDEIIYMPVIRLERNQADRVQGYLQNYKAYGFEFTTGPTEENLIDFKALREKGYRIWVNSLWGDQNAGNHDDRALENPDVYDWYVNHDVNIIQTDRIRELVDYLKRKGIYAY